MLPASGAILQIVVNWLYTDESPRLSGENFKFSVGQIRGISMKFRDCICHYEEIEDVEFLCNVLVTADHFLLPLLKERCERRLTEVCRYRLCVEMFL